MKGRLIFRLFLMLLFLGSFGVLASTNIELKLGRDIAATILGKYQQTTNHSLIQYVNLVGQSVVSTSGRKDIPFYFTVIESSTPNALACPGGYVFLTTGLIDLIKNEAELAGILAHEIAHINQQHVFNKVYQAPKPGNILTDFFTTKNTSMSIAFNEISNQAMTLIFQKGLNEMDEYEADIAAVLYLQNTGYKSHAYLDIISRLPRHQMSHSKTHPSIQKRIESIASIYPFETLNRGKLLIDRYKTHAL